MPRLMCFVQWLVVALAAVLPCITRAEDADQKHFDRVIAPLLAARCFDCHSGKQPEGKLDLTQRATAFKGGESGAGVVASQPDQSEIWKRVAADEMPPKHPLKANEKKLLRDWLQAGAVWGSDPVDRFKFTTDRRAGYDWWAFQPLANSSVPQVQHADWPKSDLDRFVLKKLEDQGLAPSDTADPRTQIRRLYFDLIGLPPTPEQVAAFMADPSDARYAKIVDDLLASPRYGERWARHWLDIVRYGESNGFERNDPRRNFWQYRDWVIQALNADLSYDEFVRRQIAGDVYDSGPDGAAAAGFMVAGVHNTVVGSSDMMRKLALQDEYEEVIGTIGQTFLGLTVQCARCHDHKFDPVSSTDYYRLIANIQGAGHGEKEVRTADKTAELAALATKQKQLADQLTMIDRVARDEIIAARRAGKADAPKPPTPAARWEFDRDFKDSIGAAHGKPIDGAKLENGALIVDGKGYVETEKFDRDVSEKTLAAVVQLEGLDQAGGGVITIQTLNGNTFDSIIFAERESKRWMAGSNGFARTQPFKAPEDTEAASRPVHVAIVYQADGTITGYRDGKPYGSAYKSAALQPFQANGTNFLFGLRHAPAGGNRHLKARIHQASFYDKALGSDAVAAAAGAGGDYVSEEDLVAWLKSDRAAARLALKTQLADTTRQHDELNRATKQMFYTVVSKGPGPTNILPRGNVNALGEAALPGGVSSLPALRSDFGLSAESSDHERRRKLAEWITNADNALFARVIVNRLWHYHFGTGIVETPNDFGFNGGRPSHPELLDWLAQQLRASKFQLKPLHRLIVNSATYRQGSRPRAEGLTKDAGNRLLWRTSPRRLEAEAVRDAALMVAGQLNLQAGGPSIVDVSITSNNGTTYYEPLDVNGPEFFRRSIFRFTPRGGRSTLFDAFDCPDPSATAPRRQVTTTPLQALSLFNNAFMLRMSEALAERIRKEVGENAEAQIRHGWMLTLGRSPDAEESRLAAELVSQHGLRTLCRALLNGNEFVVIE